MRIGKYLGLNLPDYTDAADIAKLVENFERLEERAPAWTNLSNSGTVLESTGDFQVAPVFPVGDMDVFALTLKMPRAFAEGDTITVDDVVYNLYQGTDPALSEAWKAGEVVTINFDKTSRRCWASAGGGAPRPLPAQVSNMQASTPEGETPSIVFTWTNPSDENFAGMILVIKEGSAPNSVTDGTQVYKGTGTTFTYTEGVQWERTYYGRGFAYNSQNKFQMDATGAIASATPSDVPNPVSELKLEGNKGSAVLSWVNPTQLSFDKVKVIQKIDSDPENPNDGTEVYSGTDTTVTVSGLQDSINYHFAVFAIGKNGKYKPPVVKTYIPEIWPKYDYTGNATLLKDNTEQGWWRIKFLSSGVLTWLSEDAEIDVFLVGGGASGSSSGGGGGGYTATHKKVSMSKSQRVQIQVGAGGASGNRSSGNGGGASSFDSFSARGGSSSHNGGGSGGSGGGGSVTGLTKTAGAGGTDGGSGGGYTSSGTYYREYPGGSGQGKTTREFGDSGADLYSGGGGGSCRHSGGGSVTGAAGAGGGGTPILAATGRYTGGTISDFFFGGKAGGGYGGGGGGGDSANAVDYGNGGGSGAQGICIIRNAR
nr:MAG TPA: Interferon alpha/beta receptor 1, Interferon Type III, Helical cytokine.9A [Caudoviricetes sp.]